MSLYLLAFSIGIALLVNWIKIFIPDLQSSLASSVGIVVGSMMVGQLYAQQYHEVPSRSLRIKALGFYALWQLVFTLILFYVLPEDDPLVLFVQLPWFAAGVVIILSLYLLVAYFLIGSGAKTQIRALKKLKAKQQKKKGK